MGSLRLTDKLELKKIINQRIKEQGPKCNLNDIDVSDVEDMSALFEGTDFNGDISKWDVSSVKNMGHMFSDSKFNGDISKWDVSKVRRMGRMFWKSIFNGDISDWDVSNVIDMWNMFCDSKFDGDLSNWDVDMKKVQYAFDMFKGSPLEGNEPSWYEMN